MSFSPVKPLIALAWLALATTAVAQQSQPPVARTEATRLELHGDVRMDEYYWLRERENPEVIEYLEAENAYTDAMTAHLEGLRENLFEEIKRRIKQDDSSVPFRRDEWFYYRRFEDGKQYPIYARKKGSLEAPEEILVDANALAEGHDFLSVSADAVSPDHRILAYAADTVGRRFYDVRFKDQTTGEILPDQITAVTSNLAWANDNRTLFYSKQDPVTLRWHQVWRHRLGTDASRDELVYEEPDETFNVWVFRTKSERYVMIASWQTLASEYRYLDADRPQDEPRVFLPRERNHEYDVDHLGDHFYIRTNDGARNFRLMRTPLTDTSRESWEEVIPHREDVLIQGFEVFRDYLVVTEREGGLVRLRVRPWADPGAGHYLDFGEPAYLAYVENNREIDSGVLRYGYTSLTTPNSVFDYDMATREKTLLKRDEVLGGFDTDHYVTERI
ncbi:MAG: oligopeptidase B, partial [Gemmatimonadota bacterium]